MCSIMVIAAAALLLRIFKEGFGRTVSRGPDDSRIINTEKGLLGFQRLSIMGLALRVCSRLKWMKLCCLQRRDLWF